MAAPARRLIQPRCCWAMFLTATAGWCLVLALATTALPGTTAQQVDFLNAPSASECRVHIEAALKQVVQEPASTEEESRGDQADVESISNEGTIESAEADSAAEEGDNDASAEDTTAEDTASVEDGEASAEKETEESDASSEQPEDGDASVQGDSLIDAAREDEGSLEQADETEEGQSGENAEENDSVDEAASDVSEDSVEGEPSAEDVAAGETAEESGSLEQQASGEDTTETTESTEDAASQEQTDEASTEAGAESAEETGDKSDEEAQDTEETTEQTSVEEAAGESQQESGEAAEQESVENADDTTQESVENTDDATQESVESAEATQESVEEGAQESLENVEENTQESVENAEENTKESTENAEDSAQESTENAESTEAGETAEEGTVEAESVEESAQEGEDSESAEAQPTEKTDSGSEPAEEDVESAETKEQEEGVISTEDDAKSEEGEGTEGGEKLERKRREVGEEPTEGESTESTESAEVVNEADATNATEVVAEAEDFDPDIEIPSDLRPKDHVSKILRLDAESVEPELILAKTVDSTLRELKRLYDTAIKPLEMLYKYRDLSNRHFGDPEIFSKPLILFMGPWSGGKSTIINYLMDIEYTSTALRTGAEPSPAYFNILMHGDREEVLDGTQLAADWTFSGLQKFGQGLLDRLRGLRLNNRLLEKVNIVEIPGILEIRKQVERVFPFNDACQWFIDRADVIFLVYDPSKLDVGPETEAILDQLKGREYQTRIILNKADQVRPEELMRVQGTLIWNISPLMSSSEPPVMYSTSLWAVPYEPGAPTRLLYAQEVAFLKDIRDAITKRVENKIASARRFAVRVRNHAKMVDCYLTTYYNHKTLFGNKQKISDDIIERPQNYHIYEGLSTLTNISRYDLPDPEVYRDFFKLNPLYEFQQLAATCTYFRGCPINRLDVAIAYDLPELVGKYKKTVEQLLASVTLNS